ncbi:hypothetical protein HPB47_024699 [Ixodes persulcatus]|uniref:Uncharacterized protein n=1 Tax=Ixodes persulcatus TaxID=34615 RepID=A0AC60Q5N4_IXOPE|nr:hypothetical protein HPB47_024699 [Ixodes persulcatus]
MVRMAASMNFPPVSDARKVTEKKAAADAQRQEEAAQKAAEVAVFDDQSKCFKLLELVQNYSWLYGKLRRDDKDNPKRENVSKEVTRLLGVVRCKTQHHPSRSRLLSWLHSVEQRVRITKANPWGCGGSDLSPLLHPDMCLGLLLFVYQQAIDCPPNDAILAVPDLPDRVTVEGQGSFAIYNDQNAPHQCLPVLDPALEKTPPLVVLPGALCRARKNFHEGPARASTAPLTTIAHVSDGHRKICTGTNKPGCLLHHKLGQKWSHPSHMVGNRDRRRSSAGTHSARYINDQYTCTRRGTTSPTTQCTHLYYYYRCCRSPAAPLTTIAHASDGHRKICTGTNKPGRLLHHKLGQKWSHPSHMVGNRDRRRSSGMRLGE